MVLRCHASFAHHGVSIFPYSRPKGRDRPGPGDCLGEHVQKRTAEEGTGGECDERQQDALYHAVAPAVRPARERLV